jgi:hypothetical protein
MAVVLSQCLHQGVQVPACPRAGSYVVQRSRRKRRDATNDQPLSFPFLLPIRYPVFDVTLQKSGRGGPKKRESNYRNKLHCFLFILLVLEA